MKSDLSKMDSDYIENFQNFMTKSKLENQNKSWNSFIVGNAPKDDILNEFMNKNKFSMKTSEKWPGVILRSYSLRDNKYDESILVDQWEKYLKTPYIPYNLKKRNEIFSDAYKKLDKYIKTNKAFPPKELRTFLSKRFR